MSPFSQLKLRFGRNPAQDEGQSVDMSGSHTDDKNPAVTATGDDTISPHNGMVGEEQDPEKDLVPAEDAQRGVQEVEAVALTWTKPYLIAVFIK